MHNKLNSLQSALRQLAAAENGEQSFGESDLEDFQHCVHLEDETNDLVAGLCELLRGAVKISLTLKLCLGLT